MRSMKSIFSSIKSFVGVLNSRRSYLFSYVLSSLIQIVISLSQMIIVIKVCGLEEWKIQTLGILAGGVAGTLIDGGFSVGANRVIGNLNQSALIIFFRKSLILRFRNYFVILLIAPLLSLVLLGKIDFLFLAFVYSQGFLSLTSDWILIALDERRKFMWNVTFPKVLFSIISLSLVFAMKSSLPLVFTSIVIVLWGNYKIHSFLRKRSNVVSNLRVSKDELQLRRVALSKVFGDIYWLAPGLILQLLSPDYLVFFLIWDRITKFFMVPSMAASQSLTGYLANANLIPIKRIRLTLIFHLVLATFFSFFGFYLIRIFYPVLAEDNLLSNYSACLTACFIFLVIVNRGFILHIFYMSKEVMSALLGNTILLFGLALYFYPNYILRLEDAILALVVPQILVSLFFLARTKVYVYRISMSEKSVEGKR
jgi:hypothetical protein